MNKKGFTLIELIVAITILGIITALAFSGVSNLVESNRRTKFEEYGQSLIYSAKVYVDSYGEDMFYKSGSAVKCHKLTLSYLIAQNKVKDITQKDATCANDSYIVIYKIDKTNYVYSVNLRCEDTNKHTELYTNASIDVDNDPLKQFDYTTKCGPDDSYSKDDE